MSQFAYVDGARELLSRPMAVVPKVSVPKRVLNLVVIEEDHGLESGWLRGGSATCL
jgi:hypothetical protein